MNTEAAAKPRYGSSRVASIDAARGAAMLFVCLAHFANAYHFVSGADDTGGYIVMIGLIASPTFVTVSGLVAGFLAVTRSSSFAALRRKLFDRGLFLLVVGHAILALSGIVTGRGFSAAYRVGYITDVIGFAVMFGPALVTSLQARSRLLLAMSVFALSWAAVFLWIPTDGLPALAKHYLIGAPNPADWTRGDFPLIPWFAVYLAGTVLGERLGKHYLGKTSPAGHRFLATIGIGSISFAVAIKVGLTALKLSFPSFAQSHPNLLFVLSPYQKFPPGLVYVTFFGGAGMLLVAAILEAGRRRVLPLLLNQLRQIGLASLFVYVLQYYLYVVVLRGLRLPYSPFWPVLFLVSIAILAAAAAGWNAIEGNRFLTVGIGALLKRIERSKSTVLTQEIRLDASIS
ncbi:MAG TPA: heparan-alpha-glucosaminide N-acetyltransferase domain-containing protein [Gemmatimonadaceae bacterium]